MKQSPTITLFAILTTVAHASIEGNINWPSRLLGEDATLTLTIRGDRRAFRRPALELYRNNEVIHTQQFTVSNDLPLRLDFHLGCSLFKAKGLYEVRVIGTPGTPPVYTTGKKLLDSYPNFTLSFLEDEVEALSREIMVMGMFNKRAICHQSESLIVVKMESIEREEVKQQDDFAIYIRFPSDALKIPCSAFNRPGQYRLTAVLDGDVISHSKPLTVLPSTQYSLSIKRRIITNLNRIELDQCRPDGDGYFDVDYVAPPCAANHKLKLEPRHQSRRFELTPKIFDLTPHSNTIRLKCRDIHHAAHGACLHYLDEFGQTQATLCFALPGKPTPPIDGQWTRWGDERKCTAPCDLAGLGDVTYTSAGLNDQSEWTVKQRQCASPAALGNGRKCNTQTTQVATDVNNVQVEYSVEQSSCRNPWQLARQIVVTESGSESCECGCTKQVDNAAIAIFSPAPWRCQSSNELNWTFECIDCDSIIMHVLHFDLDETEQLFIHESEDKIFRIDSIGSTQHQTKTVKIRYQRPGHQSGCGFAIRLAFSQALLIPNSSHDADLLPITDLTSEDTAANLGLWGILVCSGFLIILLVASIMNCRSSNSGDNETITKHHHVVTSDKVYSSTQETDVMLDESFSRSPTKIKPNAATYSLAQHQLRLMKQGGQVSAVANYPRELFECEKQAKEQIPLLFGLDNLTKHNSGTSVGSDQVEAAPTSSNRTETTHSTAISDESNNCRQQVMTLYSQNNRPDSFADNESSSAPPSPKFPPPNSRVQSSGDDCHDNDHVERL